MNTATPSAQPPNAAELDTLLALLTAAQAQIVSIGHGRDLPYRQAAMRFADAWTARGGEVLTIVDWPEQAASWLRAARRFTASIPDAWVVAAASPGWSASTRRRAEGAEHTGG